MAEAEGVLAGSVAPVGTDRAPCGRARVSWASGAASSGASASTAPRWNILALDRRRARARRARPGRAGRAVRRAAPGSSAARSTSPLPTCAHQREHLLDEERVALGRLADACARGSSSSSPSAEQLVDQAVGLPARRAARAATVVAFSLPPPQPARRSSSSGRAMQSSRIGASRREIGDVLDEVEERRLAPVEVVEHDHERRSRARPPRAACGTPTPTSLRRRDRRPRRRATPGSCAAATCVDRRAPPSAVSGSAPSSCSSTSTTRPVGDPLAVREAAAAHDREPRRASRGTPRTSRDLPTPAVPSTVNSWQAAVATRSRPNASRSWPSSRSRPTIGASRRRRPRCARRDRDEPVRRHRLASCPSARAARAAPPRPRRARARSVSAPIRISPGCAACSSRAATLTASPVASRSSVPVTTSPVVTPIRSPSMLRAQASASRISTAARTARNASSSCSDRHAEHGHHGVADELLHGSAVSLDDRLHPLEVACQQRPQATPDRASPRATSSR